MVYNKMIQDLDVNIHILNLKSQFILDQRPNYYSSTMVPYFRVTARLSSPQTAHARYLRITKRARPPIFILLEPRREPRYKPFYFLQTSFSGVTLVVQRLRPQASTVGSTGSVPGWGTKIPHGAAKIKKIPF